MFNNLWGLGGFVVRELASWTERRDAIRSATLEARLAEIKARTELAAYKVKSDVEWDLTWAGQAQTSWKDEFLLILWSIPLLAFVPALFFPEMREGVMATLTFVEGLHPLTLEAYAGGWVAIFSATFGLKALNQSLVGGRVTKVAGAFKALPDDIPQAVAKAAQGAVGRALKEGRAGAF